MHANKLHCRYHPGVIKLDISKQNKLKSGEHLPLISYLESYIVNHATKSIFHGFRHVLLFLMRCNHTLHNGPRILQPFVKHCSLLASDDPPDPGLQLRRGLSVSRQHGRPHVRGQRDREAAVEEDR